MFNLIYRVLKARLEAISSVEAVSWYNGQPDQNNEEAVYAIPHVYIEFLPIELGQSIGPTPYGELRFRVHLYSEYHDDDNEVFTHLDLVGSIHAELLRFQGMLSDIPEFAVLKGTANDRTVFNQLVRTRIIPDHAQTNTIISITEYKGAAVDISAFKAITTISPDLITSKQFDV